MESREEKSSVTIWELDSDNSDVCSHFTVASDTDENSKRNTRVFCRFVRNFHHEINGTVVNFPSSDWLSYRRTLSKAFVSGVCLRSKTFFLALFSVICFFRLKQTLSKITS